MPKFLHERGSTKELFNILAAEKNILPAVVEKDYWIMHCLWGLQKSGLQFEMKGGTSLSKGWGVVDRFSEDIDIRFDAPASVSPRGEKPAQIAGRFAFYDDLAARIKIDGIVVERNPAYDDTKAQNGGIGLKYPTHFPPTQTLKPEVLLEVGFDKTTPNQARDFSSWAMERAREKNVAVRDNRALGVPCFNPEYTFVDKIQTICRRYRQFRDRNDAAKDKPQAFLRHYYDLYMLLEVPRVKAFIGTADYAAYKKQKLKPADAAEFATREAFVLKKLETYARFEEEFQAMNAMLTPPRPKFADIMARIRERAASL